MPFAFMPAKPKPSTKSVAPSSVWAVLGSDDLKVKDAASGLVRKLVAPDNLDFGLEIIEGAADNVESAERIIGQTIEAIQTIPFMGGEKVVWLKGATFLADTMIGRSETILQWLDRLTSLLQGSLPPDVKFILTAAEVDKRRSFFLNLKKYASVEVFDAIDTSKAGWEEQVMQIVLDRADDRGLAFDDEALNLFVMLAGEQSQQIESELEKLDLFLGEERRVTVEAVRGIVAQTRTGILWDLSNAITSRKLTTALEQLELLMFSGENPVGILLAAIVPKIRSLFYIRDLAERYNLNIHSFRDLSARLEMLPPEATAHLPKKKEGGLNVGSLFYAAKDSENFTAAELRRALEECLQANRLLVTTQLDPKVVLNQLLFRILSRPVAKAKR